MRQILLALILMLSAPAFSSPPSPALEARDQWQQAMPLLRTALEVKIHKGTQPARVLWLIWERTPHGRQRIVIQDGQLPVDQAQASQTTFLVQDKYGVALQGQQVSQVAAPWMLGVNLFDQPLEPMMLLSWAMGLPGRSYSLDTHPAKVFVDHDRLVRIEQDGWQVQYEGWSPATDARPALPSHLRLSRGDTVLEVRVDAWEPHVQPPPDYKEFAIY